MQKINSNPYLLPYIKMNSKWIIDQNMKTKNIKLQQQIQEKKVYALGQISKISQGSYQKHNPYEKKKRNIRLDQNEEYRLSKDTVNSIDNPVPDWEKICANHISDKGPVSKICKKLSELNSEKTKHPNLKKVI